MEEEAGYERITAKSRPMMNLIARVPSTKPSSASESPGKTRYESHSPLSANAKWDDRAGRPVVCHRARAHECQSRFFHEKTKHVILEEEETHDRTGTPVVCPQRGSRTQQFIIGDDETESELSLGSRSFLNRVNDQVRNDLQWM